ncbi:uncharacterized protein LOC113170313 [Anabas testudineus]|uniref:Ciliary neurotrophic factor n=1 Tax=Anabas testudineus TaxID=64144 RepID=A0AAQ6IEZ5_ANATE|nr:uncharacterized protein LOC113170313 [Anabas testudineus]
MIVWWRAVILLCCILSCVDSFAPFRVLQSSKYKNSFRLARSTRTHVQLLLKKYKEQHLGNKHFEDRSQQLKNLPLLSTDFYSWLNMTDWERLHTAFRDMQVYWKMLEWKRMQLEKEEKEGMVVRSTLPPSIKHIQLDLRDLMSQVSSQMSHMKSSWVKPTSPTVWSPLEAEASSKTVWDSRVEGYIILRDLDLYLTKVARDFLLLATKAHL